MALGAKIDDGFVQNLTHQLMGYQREFGAASTESVLDELSASLEKVSNRPIGRRLSGCYSVNQAFQSYRAGENVHVVEKVVQAITNDPKYILNRGILAILYRSTAGALRQRLG
jgi:hypothetical protein